jgi:CBS domain-containing protein
MELRDIMTRNVEVISGDATLKEVANKMRTIDVGFIPVCDGNRLKGILTDRDITIRATADGRDQPKPKSQTSCRPILPIVWRTRKSTRQYA